MLTCSDGGGGDDGGLINPAGLIAKSADLDTSLITGAADGVRAMGSTVDTKTDEIATTWSTKLPGCYTAPEQADVYALMTDPATASETLKTTFDKMAGFLDTYASALDGIKPKLADFEKRAQAFRNDVIGGVRVDAREAKDANGWTFIKEGAKDLVGADNEMKTVPWYEDGDTVEKNNNFLDEIAGIYAEVSTAASTCATDINGLTGLPADKKEIPPIPKEAFTDPENPMPWGNPREEDRNCPESVGHGAYQFGKGTVEGLGSLISYNPETGDWGDWGHAGQAWMGTGNLLLSLAITTSPAAQLLNGVLKATGNGDSDVSQWIDERNKLTATAGASLVGIDLTADDPFHKWKEDGVATFTESFLTVGTLFIPGAGEVSAGLKAASIGSRVAKISSAIADFAVPGGSWLAKGGVHAIPVLKNLFKFGDDMPMTMLDDVAKGGAKVPSFTVAGAIDDMVPTQVTKPVTSNLFGDGLDVDAPRTTPSSHSEPQYTQPATHPNGDPASVTTRPEPVTHPNGDPASVTTRPEPVTHPETVTEPAATTTHPEPVTHPETVTEPAADHPAAETPVHHGDTPTHDGPAATHAPDGGPIHDRHGRPYTFDPDGRRHVVGDLADGTYRDKVGRLRNDLHAVTDTNPHVHSDLPQERSTLGTSDHVDVNPADRAAHDLRVESRDQALDASHVAHDRLVRLVESTGIDPQVLEGSTRTVTHRIRNLVDDGALTVKEGRSLTNALVHDRVSSNLLRSVSERLGDKAAAAVARMRGEISLVGSGRAGSGRFDQVTLSERVPPTMKFYEAKGGTAQLGERTVDGVRAQQGTATYFNDVMKSDKRVMEQLDAFMKQHPDSPITEAFKSGNLQIEYDLVQALPGGRIKVTPFVLDQSALKLPPIK